MRTKAGITLTPAKRPLIIARLQKRLRHLQLRSYADYMKVLEAHDLSGVEPTAHAMPVYDIWREDTSRDGFSAEEALSNAPRKAQGQFLITRVVEE